MISRRGTRWIGWILGAVATFLVLANQGEVGLARDEIVYMQNGMRYADWWIDLVTFEHGVERARITKTFGGKGATDNNREHPPLVKTLAGLSHHALHDKLGVDEVTAFRVPSAVLHGVLVMLVYAMTLSIWGFAEALLAALLVIFLPRALFHASLTAFDAPVMTMWFLTVFAYWRALDGRKWPWQPGIAFGLLLATKHNALLLPFAIVPHFVWVSRKRIVAHWRIAVSFLLLGPLTFVAVWPWMWFDTVSHVTDWLKFHMNHVHYNFEYLGQNWNAPPFPWHVALVTTLFTVPVVTLASALAGTAVWLRYHARIPDRVRAPGLLLLLSALAAIVPFVLGSTPIFGAEKHWMPALPSLCIAAGVGVVWAARQLASFVVPRLRGVALGFVGVLVVGAAAVETAVAQPYALTWYNALAGGAPGGADLGMNRQFWGVAARGVLPVLSTVETPRALPIYTHDASPAWGFYQKLGLAPRAMPDAGHEQAGIDRSQLALVIHERHFNRHDFMIWKSYGTVQPVFVLRAAGVPIVSLYMRPVQTPRKP